VKKKSLFFESNKFLKTSDNFKKIAKNIRYTYLHGKNHLIRKYFLFQVTFLCYHSPKRFTLNSEEILKTEKIVPNMEEFFLFYEFFPVDRIFFASIKSKNFFFEEIRKNCSENRINRQPSEKRVILINFLTVHTNFE
jgi:hypothetical protein